MVDTWEQKLDRMKQKVFAWARLIDTIPGGYRLLMVTLTYDYNGTLGAVGEWRENDIRKFMRTVRGHLDKKLLAYAWVVEMQGNGHPHYHIMLVVKKYTRIANPDDAKWWIKGMSRVTSKVRSVFYLCAYLKKKYQKDFSIYPKNCRLHGITIIDPDLKKQLRYCGLSKIDKFIVDNFGWSELKFKSEYRKPEWFRSRYLGTGNSKSFVEFMYDFKEVDNKKLYRTQDPHIHAGNDIIKLNKDINQ